jgi:hypothetical protein
METKRAESTIKQLAGMRHVFDRITKDGTGGRVSFFQRKPKNYDNKTGLPWSWVRGRYWYPWRKNL